MRRKYLNILKITLILFLYNSQAFAYLDPGTGGFIIQVLIALLATITFYFRTLITYIKSFFQKLRKFFKNKKT